MATIGTGMIIKNEGKIIYRSLENVRPFSTVMCIVDTGSTDDTFAEIVRFATDHGWEVQSYPTPRTITNGTIIYHQYHGASELENGDWKLWNFGRARNEYIRILDPIVDYIWWSDADDQILQPDAISHLPPADPTTPTVWGFKLITSLQPNNAVEWIHHRLFSTKNGACYNDTMWCHEYCSFPDFRHVSTDLKILHEHVDAPVKEDSTPRNLRILERQYKSGQFTPRTLFYYANTLKDASRWVEAIKIYDEYHAHPEALFHDERMYAHIYKARCYRHLGMTPQHVAACFKGMAEDHAFSELWVELSYGFNQLGFKNKARACSIAALQPPPPTQLFLEPACYNSEPARILTYTQ